MVSGVAGRDGGAAGAGNDGHVRDGVGHQRGHAFCQLSGDADRGECLFGRRVGACRVFVLLAQAHQHHALRGHAGQRAQGQGGTGAAAELGLDHRPRGAVGGAPGRRF
ncbi:hypothetical protein G6F68_018920 [Rhizopus microsporus]|nr:hypothetical protein G6F68_018920 [Rhizopus microsporus]